MDAGKIEWYCIDNPDQLDTPVLVIYPDRVKANIRLVIEMAGDVRKLRPHVKTHKCPDTTRLLLAAGIDKFKCATIAEAEMLAMTGARDVLLAYQPQGPKAHRFAALIHHYPDTQFSCLVDHPAVATAIGAIFADAGLEVAVYLDLNIGMNRTGIAPGPEAIALYQLAAGTKGLRPIGLHAYDGHIRDTDWYVRKEKCDAAFATVTTLRDKIIAATPGSPAPLIVAGGSPTFSIHCKREGIECSPGTFIYWDKGYCDICPEQVFLPAALVVTRVISLPLPGKVCLDLGHKSIAAENELSRRVHFLNATGLKPVGQSEEHLVVEPTAGQTFRDGDILYGLPFHVCPTIALYERAYTIEAGQITGEWRNSARDRKITI